jgi:hypothetical protein
MKRFVINSCVHSVNSWRLFLIGLLLPGVAAGNPAGSPRSVEQVEKIVAELAVQLKIDSKVNVAIQEHNERMVSVAPVENSTRAFLLAFDRAFLDSLTDEEVRAAVAHELGHVWIFSTHPYLHTEVLANEIALRVVDRSAMNSLYRKMFTKLGVAPGDLRHLFSAGESPTGALPLALEH